VIPLRDENPSATTPVVTRTLIALNCVAFVYEVLVGPDLRGLIMSLGLVPERLTLALHGSESLGPPVLTMITSMFLHGGWLHLLGNMWFLGIFGDNVEDRLGRVRYVVFYFACGIAAAVLHYLSSPHSRLPTVGASGAIAGVLGAYIVTYPHARVVTVVPLFPFFRIMTLPAGLVLGVWFVLQFFSGALSLLGSVEGGTAWWAHIGGFLFGMLLLVVMRPTQRRSQVWVE